MPNRRKKCNTKNPCKPVNALHNRACPSYFFPSCDVVFFKKTWLVGFEIALKLLWINYCTYPYIFTLMYSEGNCS